MISSDVVNLRNASTLGKPVEPPSKEMGKNEFMRLLMTQLGAQDPMNPMDSTAFTAQLAQFSSLEQLANVGTKLDSLVSIAGANNAANAVSVLGKEVRMDSNLIKGSNAHVAYDLAGPAQNVKIEIRNKEGRVLKLIDGQPGEQGSHEVNLTDLPPGAYSFTVNARDVSGNSVDAKLSIIDRVKSVNFNSSIPQFFMESGVDVAATHVLEIREPRSGG